MFFSSEKQRYLRGTMWSLVSLYPGATGIYRWELGMGVRESAVSSQGDYSPGRNGKAEPRMGMESALIPIECQLYGRARREKAVSGRFRHDFLTTKASSPPPLPRILDEELVLACPNCLFDGGCVCIRLFLLLEGIPRKGSLLAKHLRAT